KKMKPTWLAPPSSAAAMASSVFSPHILMSIAMASQSHETVAESRACRGSPRRAIFAMPVSRPPDARSDPPLAKFLEICRPEAGTAAYQSPLWQNLTPSFAKMLILLSPPQRGEIGRAASSPPQIASFGDWRQGQCRRYLHPLRGRKRFRHLSWSEAEA